MEENNKKKKGFPAYIVPLLAMPLIASMLFMGPKSSDVYSLGQPRFRTEAEQVDLKREILEDTINGLGMDYKSFMKTAGFDRTLPSEYDNWKVYVDVNGNFINQRNQRAVDYSEDGLGKVVQIDLSEQDAKKIIDSYRKTNK